MYLNPNQIIATSFRESLNAVLEQKATDMTFRIPQLCRAMHMSRTDLHRKIVKHTGISASIYVRDFRLQKANTLLQLTDLPIGQIAYKSGFSDHCYFTKCFKKKYGIAPSEIRK